MPIARAISNFTIGSFPINTSERDATATGLSVAGNPALTRYSSFFLTLVGETSPLCDVCTRKRETERKGSGNARGCPFVPDVNPISTADVKCRTDLGFVCVNSAGAARTREKQKASTAADPRCPVTRWRRNGLRSRGVAIRVYTDERVNFAARSRTSGLGCRITLPALYLMPQRESAVPYLSPFPSSSLDSPRSCPISSRLDAPLGNPDHGGSGRTR